MNKLVGRNLVSKCDFLKELINLWPREWLLETERPVSMVSFPHLFFQIPYCTFPVLQCPLPAPDTDAARDADAHCCADARGPARAAGRAPATGSAAAGPPPSSAPRAVRRGGVGRRGGTPRRRCRGCGIRAAGEQKFL